MQLHQKPGPVKISGSFKQLLFKITTFFSGHSKVGSGLNTTAEVQNNHPYISDNGYL